MVCLPCYVINFKMLTIVDIVTYTSMINFKLCLNGRTWLVRALAEHKSLTALKTYAAISNAHLSRVWKRVKLSGSCLSTINGFGSTQLSDMLMSYRCSDIS